MEAPAGHVGYCPGYIRTKRKLSTSHSATHVPETLHSPPSTFHHLSESFLFVWCVTSSIFICKKENYRLHCFAAMGDSCQCPFNMRLPPASPISPPAMLRLTHLLLATVSSSLLLQHVRKPHLRAFAAAASSA